MWQTATCVVGWSARPGADPTGLRTRSSDPDDPASWNCIVWTPFNNRVMDSPLFKNSLIWRAKALGVYAFRSTKTFRLRHNDWEVWWGPLACCCVNCRTPQPSSLLGRDPLYQQTTTTGSRWQSGFVPSRWSISPSCSMRMRHMIVWQSLEILERFNLPMYVTPFLLGFRWFGGWEEFLHRNIVVNFRERGDDH